MSNAVIPVNDLSRQAESVQAEVRSAIDAVLKSAWFVLGPQVEAFESEFASLCGVRHCAGVANGTDALEIALRALEIGPGDQVATVANAGGYSTTAILAAGASPVFVDIEDATMTMDPAALAAMLGRGVRAVIATHLYGRMADMPAILRASGGVPVIEDCAQAHGATLHGRPAGSWGAAGCFSFYPTKNLGAAGDGGAIVTGDAALAPRIRALRQYGWTSKYAAVVPRGRNSRLDEIQAAVLRVKARYLRQWNARRRAIAGLYNEALSGAGLGLPAVAPDSYVAHLYVLRCAARGRLRSALRRAGCGSEVHYPTPDYRQESLGGVAADPLLPVTERCCAEVLSLPCFPELHDEEVIAGARAVKLWAQSADIGGQA
jgi:dTDP-3-amino-2,3,6-trideoxy-4-keto-D-glucose/dTDP-3-amino-3,4,6-trideoxy-alpha-D-glucose/dTDP-2,6-dideoxy-D-kanosamine transaminase